MTSTFLMWLMFGQYVVIAIAAAFELNGARCLYFVSAAGIMLAVMWMGGSK